MYAKYILGKIERDGKEIQNHLRYRNFHSQEFSIVQNQNYKTY